MLFDAGRHVRSDLLLIDYAITSKKFFKNPAILDAIKVRGEAMSHPMHACMQSHIFCFGTIEFFCLYHGIALYFHF